MGRCVYEWENLWIMRSSFGMGWVLQGTHSSLVPPRAAFPMTMSAEAVEMNNAVEDAGTDSRTFHIATKLGPVVKFHELDELGTSPTPTCQHCTGCADCTFRRKRLSREDQEVVARIEAAMKIDGVTGTIREKYPWKPSVVDNSKQAQTVQRSMERHMIAASTHAGFVEEMDKSIAEGKVRLISAEERSLWHGPVHYITCFAVVKPGSLSTRTHVVSNSAMRNAVSKLSLNDCMWPGLNALCDLLDCLIFWRAVECAVMLDLQKVYQAIHTSDMELHLWRFFYRRSPEEEWLNIRVYETNIR